MGVWVLETLVSIAPVERMSAENIFLKVQTTSKYFQCRIDLAGLSGELACNWLKIMELAADMECKFNI